MIESAQSCAEILEQSVEDKKQVGTGLSYTGPSARMAKSIPEFKYRLCMVRR